MSNMALLWWQWATLLVLVSAQQAHDESPVHYQLGGRSIVQSRASILPPMDAEVIPAELNKVYTGVANVSTVYIFVFEISDLSQDWALRVWVGSQNATLDLPLLFAVRQQRGILSWPLPLALQRQQSKYLYMQVSKTICPVQNYIHSVRAAPAEQDLFLEVSTASQANVGFQLQLRKERIVVQMGAPAHLQVSPSSPQFVRFNFPDGVNIVLVKVTSPDDICSTVSIQNISCPIFDTQQDVAYGNQYQTMTVQAGITVQRDHFPRGLFIVFVVHGDDSQCSHSYEHISPQREKSMQLTIQEKISHMEYLTATLGALGFCGLFYLFSIILSIIHFVRQRRQRQQLPDPVAPPVANYGTISTTGTGSETSGTDVEGGLLRRSGGSAAGAGAGEQPGPSAGSAPLRRVESDSSLDETDIDMMGDASDDKNILRSKTFLYVSDLARKNPRVLAKKSQLYIWNLLTVAIFYAVPVVQLVITYQKVLNVTGDQDICYYNFLCAHPLGVLSDFNHVYSNVGYVLLGLLFIGLTKRRDLLHQRLIQQNDRYEQSYGIPQHFGLFYAMGIALMMEGILSACYHVCPSYSNFQFDTAFMYVIAVLCMLKIYQTRHPDINAGSYAAFLVLAFTVFVGVLGVVEGNAYFWMGFIALHLCVCIVISAQIYWMGRWSLDAGVLVRVYQGVRNDLRTSPTHCFRPAHPDRMVLLVIGNLVNLALAVLGGVTAPKDFASHLLTIFITNLLLYTGFYIIMKLRHKERILLQPLLYILLSCLAWAAALFFFFRKSITWQLSPAQSRARNRECEIFNFYDDHDIWHFLSASSMFFSFMILLTLDDDLVFTPRDKIPVF